MNCDCNAVRLSLCALTMLKHSARPCYHDIALSDSLYTVAAQFLDATLFMGAVIATLKVVKSKMANVQKLDAILAISHCIVALHSSDTLLK